MGRNRKKKTQKGFINHRMDDANFYVAKLDKFRDSHFRSSLKGLFIYWQKQKKTKK